MFFGQIERECLYGEVWTISPTTKLPDHLQLLVDQEEVECDIWKFPSQKLDNQPTHASVDKDSSTRLTENFRVRVENGE